MTTSLKLPEPDHYRKEDLMRRWSISSGVFDDLVQDVRLRLAWRINQISPKQAGRSLFVLPLDGLPADALIEIRSGLDFFQGFALKDIDQFLASPNRPELIRLVDIPLQPAPQYIYGSGFHYQDPSNESPNGSCRSLMHENQAGVACFLVEGVDGQEDQGRMVIVDLPASELVVPRGEVEALEDDHGGSILQAALDGSFPSKVPGPKTTLSFEVTIALLCRALVSALDDESAADEMRDALLKNRLGKPSGKAIGQVLADIANHMEVLHKGVEAKTLETRVNAALATTKNLLPENTKII